MICDTCLSAQHMYIKESNTLEVVEIEIVYCKEIKDRLYMDVLECSSYFNKDDI